MAIGAVVELTLPASGVSFDETVYTTSPPCYFQGSEALPDEIDCLFERNTEGREVITWISSHDPVDSYETFQVWAVECANNPFTTEKTGDFELRIYSDSTKTVL